MILWLAWCLSKRRAVKRKTRLFLVFVAFFFLHSSSTNMINGRSLCFVVLQMRSVASCMVGWLSIAAWHPFSAMHAVHAQSKSFIKSLETVCVTKTIANGCLLLFHPDTVRHKRVMMFLFTNEDGESNPPLKNIKLALFRSFGANKGQIRSERTFLKLIPDDNETDCCQ